MSWDILSNEDLGRKTLELGWLFQFVPAEKGAMSSYSCQSVFACGSPQKRDVTLGKVLF